MFASQITDTVRVGEATVTIQALSWKTLGRATDAVSETFSTAVSRLPEAVATKLMDKESPKPAEDVKPERAYGSYDRAIVLQAGIKSFGVEGKKVSAEAIADLKEEVAEQLHRAILDISLPDPKDEEEKEKNS